MTKFLFGQEVLFIKERKKGIILYVYEGNNLKENEYRVDFGAGLRQKIIREEELAPVVNIRKPPKELYHFSDIRNIESIKRFGLLSWYELEKRNIKYYPASNQLSRELDLRKGLHTYVRLCVDRQHPLALLAKYEKRIQQLVWLEIDIAVTRWKQTLFSNKNANSNDAIIDINSSTALRSPDLQAEVLIPNSLSIKWINF